MFVKLLPILWNLRDVLTLSWAAQVSLFCVIKHSKSLWQLMKTGYPGGTFKIHKAICLIYFLLQSQWHATTYLKLKKYTKLEKTVNSRYYIPHTT